MPSHDPPEVIVPGIVGAYRNFCVQVARTPEYIRSAAEQRIHRDMELTINGDTFLSAPITPEHFHYTSSKIKQLTRHYLHEASLTRAAADVLARVNENKYGSGVFMFRGEPKKNTRQDFCIASGVMGYYPKRGLRLIIHYRTTELIRRCTGDLVFFQSVILPYFQASLEIAPLVEVKIKFDHLTFHPMFSPFLALHFRHTWFKLWQEVKRANLSLHDACMYFHWRYYVDPRDTFANYASGNRVKVLVANHFPDYPRLIHEYMEEHYADLHQLPRGRRRDQTRTQGDGASRRDPVVSGQASCA